MNYDILNDILSVENVADILSKIKEHKNYKY